MGLDPVCLLLGMPHTQIKGTYRRELLYMLTYAARKSLLLKWISDKPLTLSGWHKIIFNLLPVEYPTYWAKGKIDIFRYMDSILGLCGTYGIQYFLEDNTMTEFVREPWLSVKLLLLFYIIILFYFFTFSLSPFFENIICIYFHFSEHHFICKTRLCCTVGSVQHQTMTS